MSNQKGGEISRRKFMRQGAVLGIGASSINVVGAEETADDDGNSQGGELQLTENSGALNENGRRFLKSFGLRFPIFQAAPGREALAVAVANSGGMGAISLTWDSPKFVFDLVTRMNAAT